MTRKQHRAGRGALGALALGSVLALGACGTGTNIGGATPTETPNVTTILQHAQTAKYKDAAFTMSMNGSASGETVTDNVSGEETTSPKRLHLSISLTTSVQTVSYTIIDDIATNTSYTQTNLPGVDATTWTKESLGSGLASVTDPTQLVDFSELTGAKLAGTTTKNGVAVWHITGSETNAGTTGTVDAYIRQSDNLPAEVDFKTSGATATALTLSFTQYNTGLIISLPPASQISNG